MLNLIQFNSKSYQAISWKSIFNSAGTAVSRDYQSLGLVNSTGLVMIADNVLSFNRIGLCFENEIDEVDSDHLLPVKMVMFDDSDILLFRLNHKNFFASESNLYTLFINKIIGNAFDAFQTIFSYTYEHLTKRQYNNQVITQMESVQLQFVDIHILFERIRFLLSNELSIEQCVFAISLLIQALDHLAKLAGARAILKNNVVELIFYLKIFQKFINKNEI